MPCYAMDALSIVEDEVALEGLDGITVQTLWIRLEGREPAFPLRLDGATKEFIWRSLVNNTDLTFFQIPQEREDVVLFDRFKDPDSEASLDLLDAIKDIYPVHILPENKNGIQGSCAFFKERKDISKHLRSPSTVPSMSLEEALERYGRKLVVVASQTLRFRALIGPESDPDLKLTDDSYRILERVGRARWQGELQSDLHRSSFKIDSRKVHYLRKALVRHGLVTMQHATRMRSGQQQHSILLLLKRFHVNRRSKYDILMENTSDILQQMHGQLATVTMLREQMNVSEKVMKRVIQYMRAAKMVDFCRCPLEDLDKEEGPCLTKKGNKVLVRCVHLVKPYSQKDVAEDEEEDDEDEEEDGGAGGRQEPPEGRIMEKDLLSQTYHLVLSCGTKGISKSGIAKRMNIGKLESRTICRKLERDGAIKGFMEDEGRQRTTKFISHKCVDVSNQLQLFAQERERQKQLSSSGPPSAAKAPPTKRPRKSTGQADGGGGSADGGGPKPGAKKRSRKGDATVATEQTQAPVSQGDEGDQDHDGDLLDRPAVSHLLCPPTEDKPGSTADPSAAEEAEEVIALMDASRTASESIVVVESSSVEQASGGEKNMGKRSRETYRLLRRKNLIVEAVQNFRIIEGLFPLQKMINDEEKEHGFSSKCCKKTISRLVNSLSKEGLLKIYRTTVIQDGISRKVELVVHPSIRPSDEAVSRVIEQVRFKISSSYSALRLQHNEEKAREQEKEAEKVAGGTKAQRLKAEKKRMRFKSDDFKPTKVRGLGKSLGFQPKLHRLRVIHNFLWYLLYGHPLKAGAGAPPHKMDDASSGDEEFEVEEDEEEDKDKASPGRGPENMAVFAEDDSWKKFIPPVNKHKEFSSGWVMVGDVLLCMPLSIFIQVIQINYQVDGLEEYLNDPVKQHYLVRTLPVRMRRQLLYRRRYIFTFHENLQRLAFMGLLQFSPIERFKDKDQVFLYLKLNATIVDTTNAEPHYWLVMEPPDKPFERRRYTFNTAEDVENYWFDLMCVCLNTPLGVVRIKRNSDEDVPAPSFVHEHNMCAGMAYLLRGSLEVCDDGSIPGDGKGAGGLDSEFFAHLKRNWLWTNRLLSVRPSPGGSDAVETKIRLKSLLSKDALRMALKAGGSTTPHYLTVKRPLIREENVEMVVEPSSRNQEVVGGKRQKRRRNKKEAVKLPRKKKKEPKKRTPAHDEADHRALKMMTRQRVYWSLQEDSLMMLCSVASHLLNSMLKRPFVPYCVVRDLLQAEFEISLDKTSVAVGRRTRYILKNPQTFLNYRICLAEVHQDKPLLKLLEDNKPADPNDPEDCARCFSEFVRLLRQKFSAVLSAEDVNLPDTKRELFSRFRVCAIDNGKRESRSDVLSSTEEIHAVVLHNLIQSTLAMTNCQMKSSRSFQTFHMYSKYDQELLCRVFLRCRRRGLVNRRRVNQSSGPKKNRGLPILPMSYQLSQSYYRLFSWRFPHSLCTDSFRFLRALVDRGTSHRRPFTTFCHETEARDQSGGGGGEDVSGTASRLGAALGGDGPSTGGRSPQPPTGEEEERGGAEAEAGGPEERPDLSDMLCFSMDSPGGSCLVSLSLMTLGLLSTHVSIPKQMVVVDSSLVDTDADRSVAAPDEEDEEDDDADECEAKKKMEVKSHQASHTKYLMMRGYCCPGIVKLRNLNTCDNIVVESCAIRLQLRDSPAHPLFAENSPPLDFSRCGPSLVPSVLTRSIKPSASSSGAEELHGRLVLRRSYSPQDVEACALLRSSLDGVGELGMDVQEFSRLHAHLREPEAGRSRGLQQYMKDLQEEDQVLKVGSLGPRWVLVRHAEPWLLTVSLWSKAQSLPASSRRSIPFMRKRPLLRPIREDDDEEPPAKKPPVDGEEGRSSGPGGDLGEPAGETAPEDGGSNSQETGGGPAHRETGGGPAHRETVTERVRARSGRRSREDGPDQDGDGEHRDALSFVSRPWRMVDGQLNRQVCKGMLEAVLYHVMSRPGVTRQALVDYYRDVLQPVALMEILQALEETGCVTKKTLVNKPKASLFGRAAAAPGGPEEPASAFYEPTISCCLRLCQLLPNEPHWNYCSQ